MQAIKSIFGLIMAAVGTAGIVLSVLAVHQVWSLAHHVGREVPEIISHLEQITDSIHQQGDATVGLIEGTRERVRFISDAAEELATLAEARPNTVALLETLEEDIHQRLGHAEEFVVSMQGTLRTMSSGLLLLDSVPFFSPRVDAIDIQAESPLAAAAITLNEIADLLDQVTDTIARLRAEQPIGPRQLAQVQETLLLVDDKLYEVQSEVRQFSYRVERTGWQLAVLREEVPVWLNRGAAVANVFLLCFGFSQFSLLLHGGRMLRGATEPDRRA